MRAVKSETDHDLDSEYGIQIDPYIYGAPEEIVVCILEACTGLG